MICLIESQCKSWEHERVNAGFTALIQRTFAEKEKVFFADRGHLQCVERILGKLSANISMQPIQLPERVVDTVKNKYEYLNILDPIILKYLNEEKLQIILLSVNRGILLSVYELAIKYPKVSFYLVVHAIMEQVFVPNTPLRILYRKFIRKEKDFRWVIKQVPETKNIKFVIYNPLYKKYLCKFFDSKIIEIFNFIHHPYLLEKEYHNGILNAKENKMSISIIGAAINKKSYKIIKKVNKMGFEDKIQILLSHDRNNNFNKLKNVLLPIQDENFWGTDIGNIIRKSNWMLIPYDKNEYKLTASGVFWDAIYNRVPIFMLDSPYFLWYSKYEIGILKSKKKQLEKQILKQIKGNDTSKFVKNIEKMILNIETENSKLIKAIMEG